MIKKVSNFDQENYWNFLIKPYHQHQTLQSLTNSTKRSQSVISNAIFKGQIRSRISQPTQLKEMLDIFQLRDHIQKEGHDSQNQDCQFKFLDYCLSQLFEEGCLKPPLIFVIILFYFIVSLVFKPFSSIQRTVQKFVNFFCKECTIVSL